jgi:hypothetical protein
MRIGVCIPCHKPYLQYIEKCLESIENQTRKPDIVSISISEIDEPPILPPFSFPIEISITSDRQCQAKNRNIAASKIEVDIISFFDADDIMHQRRLESIEHAFEQDIDGFLHNNTQCSSKTYRTRPISSIFWEHTENQLYIDGFISSKDSICGRVESNYGGSTNGHFSCRQSVWKAIPFPEDHGLGEDCEYVYQVHHAGYKLGYTPDKLSYYIRDDFPEDQALYILDSYTKYASQSRPPVYTNYRNTEINNVIDYLLSDKSPERTLPIFIIDQVHEFPNTSFKKIIYNIEQMTREIMLTNNLPRMKQSDIIEVWDYSISNYNILKNHNLSVRHVPFKLNLDKILMYRNLQTLIKEYDIIFCGQMGDYRKHILDMLKSKGKKVFILEGDYTGNRDIEIGKSKLLINIHFNETYRVFETIRCEPWLASGHNVLTESSLDDDPRAISVPYDQLVNKACEILDSMEISRKIENNTVVLYCDTLEMRNPKHYDTYDIDKDVSIYNMALEFRNNGYNVIIYAYTTFNEYNGILFRHPKSFDPSSDIYIFILFLPFTQLFVSSLVNTYSIFIYIDHPINLTSYNLENVSKFFFESTYIRNKFYYLPDSKCSLLYHSLYSNVEYIERNKYKLICTQQYDEHLSNFLYCFWPHIKNNIPEAEIHLISDPNVISPEYRKFIDDIIKQPGIIERGLISPEEMIYEKKTALVHINLSLKQESAQSINESIELGCIPILSDIYKRKFGIHISESIGSERSIQKTITIYMSLVSSDNIILDEYRKMLTTKSTTYTSESLLDQIESYLKPSSSLRSEK